MYYGFSSKYKVENYYGDPYKELIGYFKNQPNISRILDLGCGQGRNALALSKLGHFVTAIDISIIGLKQLETKMIKEENKISIEHMNLYDMNDFSSFEYILMDNVFMFFRTKSKKELEFIKRIIKNSKKNCTFLLFIRDNTWTYELVINFLKEITIISIKIELSIVHNSSHLDSNLFLKMIIFKKK